MAPEALPQQPPTGGPGAGPDPLLWHSDMTQRPNPPRAGLLCVHVIPPFGGGTKVMDTNAAYLSLYKDLREVLLHMEGHHNPETGCSRVGRPGTEDINSERPKPDAATYGDDRATHPAVIKHPATSKPHLLINPCFTNYITGAGLSEAECREVFDRVSAALRHQPHVTVHWQDVDPGAMVIWDNTAT